MKESLKVELKDDLKVLIQKSISEMSTHVSVTQVQTLSDKKNGNLLEDINELKQ